LLIPITLNNALTGNKQIPITALETPKAKTPELVNVVVAPLARNKAEKPKDIAAVPRERNKSDNHKKAYDFLLFRVGCVAIKSPYFVK
jgi:hypothetical protein|tara:strand:+ start:69 stop:332 length:264 start_codon:yes stop_codon:yes gene_type:complete